MPYPVHTGTWGGSQFISVVQAMITITVVQTNFISPLGKL